MSDEAAIREVISRIDAAWREKKFDGLESCFHPDAAIVGPGHVEYTAGRSRCAESYREFATNADVLATPRKDTGCASGTRWPCTPSSGA